MKATIQIKKFQFFDEVKENLSSILMPKYNLKDIQPIQMESKNKIHFIVGSVQNKKPKEQLEPENYLFKVYSNKVYEEYIIFSKEICKIKLCSYQAKWFLFAIGYDSLKDKKANAFIPLLKIFDFSGCVSSNTTEAPILLKEIYLNDSNIIVTTKETTNKMTCFAINHTLSNAAIGFNDGSVLIVSSKVILVDSSSKLFKYLSGLIKECKTAITNIAYSMVQSEQILFITTVKKVYYYKIDEKKEEGFEISEKGILPQYFDLCESKNYFTVVNESKISIYVNLERGPSWGFEGQKQCGYCFKDYLIFVSYEDKAFTLQIFDFNNKFFALYQNTFDKILQIAIDEEFVYVLYEKEYGSEKIIKTLREKDNNEKFDTFYKKNFYDTAYEYARNLNSDQRTLCEISNKYATFLYSKGDYKKSIEQYIKTINYLDPAYVIQPFVDNAKLEYLIDYLEALHKDKEMKVNCPPDEMKDYSALLLNCYIKKKQLNKLKEFVEEKDDNEQVIDINTVIEVCKESNQSDLALSIAEKSKIIESSIQILIDIKEDYESALKTLNREENTTEKFKLFLKYGERLIDKYPTETMEYIQAFMKEIIDIKNGEDEKKKKSISSINYDSLILIFTNHEKELEKLLDVIISNDINCPVSVVHRRIEIYTEQKNIPKIKEFLQNKDYSDKLNINYLLMLFATQNIKNEILADLNEKVELKQELFIQYMDKRNYPQIIEYCQQYGKEDVNIWIQALIYFINYYNSDKTTVEYINTILKNIIGNEAVSPLVILEIFKKLTYCGFHVVKQTINEYLVKIQKTQSEDKKLLDENFKKIEKLNGDLRDLNRKSKLFNMIKCSFCNQQLYMPITYFFCGHAFHFHCLNLELKDDMSKECPTCYKKIITVLQRLKQAEEKTNDYNSFNTDLHGKKKKSDMISQYLGKGIFNLHDMK